MGSVNYATLLPSVNLDSSSLKQYSSLMYSETLEQKLTQYDPDSAGIATRALDMLQIPVPQPGEFLVGTEGVIFPHHKSGLVVRIEQVKACAEHPLIAPAVGQLNAGNFLVELVIGGRTLNCGQDEAKWVGQKIKQSGLAATDAHLENVMRLPLATAQHPEGLPVLCDRDRVYPSITDNLIQGVARIFNRARPAPMLEHYGVDPAHAHAWRGMIKDLSGSFDSVWKDGYNAGQMQKFWNKAESLTAQTFRPGQIALFRGWDEYPAIPYEIKRNLYGNPETTGSKPNHFAHAGVSYRKRLSAQLT